MKRLAVMLAILALSWIGMSTSAIADTGGYCDRLGQQVQVYPGDPSRLDVDGDGIGCDEQPGPPIAQNGDTTVGEFPGQYPNPPAYHGELAKTGDSNNVVERHPYRSAALGVVVIGLGACIVGLVRRNK